MHITDTFTREELVAALRLVLPSERAEEEANILSTPIDEVDESGVPWFPADYAGDPRIYSPGLLDLLSLVSEATALKAWTLLGVTPTEGRDRRARFQEGLQSGERTAQ